MENVDNTVSHDFFLTSKKSHAMTGSSVTDADRVGTPYFSNQLAELRVNKSQIYRQVNVNWYRVYFLDFVSNFSALALSLVKGTMFVLGGL